MSRIFAPRGADLSLSYVFPSTVSIGDYTAELKVYADVGGSVLLTVAMAPTGNGSVLDFTTSSLEVLVKADDVDALPTATDPEEASPLFFDLFITSPASIVTKLSGGPFIVLPLGSSNPRQSGEVTVSLDGEQIGVTFEVSGLGLIETMLSDLAEVEIAEIEAAAEAAGAAQVATIEAATAGQIDLIEAAASAQFGLIETAGDAQILLVEDAGDTAVAAVAIAAQGVSYNGVYATVADGLAGTTDGQQFAVKQEFGDAVDIYLNDTGDAVFQTAAPYGSTGLSVLMGKTARATISPPFPARPVFSLDCLDAFDRDGRYVPNQYADALPANLIARSTGDILADNFSAGSTIGTPNFALGPGGDMTATKVILTSGGGYHSFISRALPAGDYAVSIYIASGVGAGSQTVDWGEFGSLTNVGAAEGSYAKRTATFTSDGSTPVLVLLQNNGVSSVTLYFDQLQAAEGTTTPAFDDTFDGHGTPEFRGRGVVARDGLAIDTTVGVDTIIQLPSFPDTTTITEGAMFSVISTEDTTVATKILASDPGNGVLELGVSNGRAYANPAMKTLSLQAWESVSAYTKVDGRGYVAEGQNFDGTSQEFWLNGVPMVKRTGAFAGVSKNKLYLCSADPTFPFRGKWTNHKFEDRRFSDDEMIDTFLSMRAQHALSLEDPVTPFWFEAIDGDSISADGTGLTTYFLKSFNDGRDAYGRNRAVSGSVVASVLTRLPEWVRMARAARLSGQRLVFSLMIGTNDVDTGGVVPSITDYRTIWTAMRDEGAKVVASTIVHKVGDAAVNARVDTLNGLIDADSDYYDVLCDVRGVLTETVGVDYVNALHPNQTGQNKLAAVSVAARDAARLI